MHIPIVDDQQDFLLIDKPPGLLTYGTEASDSILSLLKTQTAVKGLHPVHRLDRATSGLLLLAKTEQAKRDLSLCFQNREMEKVYVALVNKRPKKSQGKVTGDMEKARNGSWRLARSLNNPAVTHFVSRGLGDGNRLVILKPITGKTHQLRVAMKSLAAPIIGDDRYGGRSADRMYLHAAKLTFVFCNKRYSYQVAPESGILFQSDVFIKSYSEMQQELDWFQS